MAFSPSDISSVKVSKGFLIPPFLNQTHEERPVTITNPEMTMFMMTLDGVADLVLYAFEHGEQGESIHPKKAPVAATNKDNKFTQ